MNHYFDFHFSSIKLIDSAILHHTKDVLTPMELFIAT